MHVHVCILNTVWVSFVWELQYLYRATEDWEEQEEFNFNITTSLFTWHFKHKIIFKTQLLFCHFLKLCLYMYFGFCKSFLATTLQPHVSSSIYIHYVWMPYHRLWFRATTTSCLTALIISDHLRLVFILPTNNVYKCRFHPVCLFVCLSELLLSSLQYCYETLLDPRCNITTWRGACCQKFMFRQKL